MDETALLRYEFKKKLEELEAISGRATELISLYIPPTRQISDAVAYLRSELSESSNIKSKSTRKNVMAAIESILSRLRFMRKVPPNGIAFFVGHKMVSADQTEMVQYVIEPPEPIVTFLYRCNSSFYLDPLKEMLREKEIYGLLTIDRSEATIGFLRGRRIVPVRNIQSRVPSKHGRGGQSQKRFERLIEIAAHEFFKKVGDAANEIFLNESEIKGILVGGPGSTKVFFVQKNYLHHELKEKVIDTFDTGYTDEYGLKELVEKASDALSNVRLMKEKRLMRRLMKEVIRDRGLATYGLENVIRAMSLGAVEVVLLSERLRAVRYRISCTSCGRQDNVSNPPDACPYCGSPVRIEEIDVVKEIHDLASQSGADVEFISPDSEEGAALLTTFGGVGALLRFRTED